MDSESGSNCVVIFGSSFAGDMEYQHLCRNINRVKLCMETGKTCVLLNLRSLYESLYELLNQYYMRLGDKRYVEIGLGVHRVKCRVHEDFRLVVIAAEAEVLNTFPIPLLNRLEKHVLSTAGVLEADSEAGNASAAVETVALAREWAASFVEAQPGDPRLALRDAFVGFSADLLPAIVLKLQLSLQQQQRDGRAGAGRAELLARTKDMLLRMATPDAVLRMAYTSLGHEAEAAQHAYFVVQPHARLRHHMLLTRDSLSCVTTHEHPVPPLSALAQEAACERFPPQAIAAYALGRFDSETQFEASVRQFYSESEGAGGKRLLLVQVASQNLGLLTCAKYIVQSNRPPAAEGPSCTPQHHTACHGAPHRSTTGLWFSYDRRMVLISWQAAPASATWHSLCTCRSRRARTATPWRVPPLRLLLISYQDIHML